MNHKKYSSITPIPLWRILSLLILILGSSCDSLGLITSTPTPLPIEPSPIATPQPETLVTFYVDIPIDSPTDEPILFSVLDEVTGLALNAKRYTMEVIDEYHYSLSLPFVIGTTVKYRYSRQSTVLGEEHTSDGRPVRYRLYYVEAPGEVHDVITRWNDTLFNESTGRIMGSIRSTENGEPIPGLLVTAGGSQVFSTGDGSFLIEGLIPGIHNLVAYALDGSYRTFQQGASVAAESTTPAEIQIHPTPNVDITFILSVPEDTIPGVPLRLAGNLYQLGNTFSNLGSGISAITSRMPVLNLLPDGRYGLILPLPAGADIRYKYTLGDGFWNTERAPSGDFVVRQFIVPDTPTMVEDSVATWLVGDSAPITFDVSVPANTPQTDHISIQLNPYSWTEPLPMWLLQEGRWAFILFSPLDMVERLGYRFCRAGQCGHADDARTPGEFTSGQIVKTDPEKQSLPDIIDSWAWFDPTSPEITIADIDIQPREPGFVAGVEFQTIYDPSWEARYPLAFKDIAEIGANQVILSPSWTYTHLDPPVLEPIPGQNALWSEMLTSIEQAKARGLNVALSPTPHFPTAMEEWWAAAPRDFSWWVTWFDSYRSFILHHADMATLAGADTLILGGEWLNPALPGGHLIDNRIPDLSEGESPESDVSQSSGVPPDAEQRWQELLNEVRDRFSGSLAWALSYPNGVLDPPKLLDQIDQIYVLWSAPLSTGPDTSLAEMQTEASRIIESDIYSLRLIWQPNVSNLDNKPIIISAAYPSVSGSTTGCLPDPISTCISPESLNFSAPDLPLLDLDLEEQALAYLALAGAINEHDWISGLVSRGYYPPVILHDKSISIHGKPAAEILAHWFPRFIGEEIPQP